MTERYFLDTNILVYAHDLSAGTKHKRARALVEQLWVSGEGALSTQVLQELCINLRRKMAPAFSLDEVREVMKDYLRWRIVVNTGESVLRALDIEARHKISFWDAMILQAAESAGASVLYSEDLSDKQKYGGIQVVNPLAE